MDNIRFNHSMPAQIRFCDVDQFGHVNNSVYFALYDLAKTTYIKDVLGDKIDWKTIGMVVANINANFMQPVYFNDQICIETSVIHLGNKSFTLLQHAIDKKSGEVKCECKSVMVMFDLLQNESMPIPETFKDIIKKYEGHL